METIALGTSSLACSRIGLGTWAIGGWMWGGTDETQAVATVRAAVDLGISLIDTAPVYGRGRSEEIVGKALAESGRRERVRIATKVALEWSADGQVVRNASRERIVAEVEDSLRRLRTDRIDLYQVHWPDPEVPMEETAEAMGELFAQGKILAVGVSNFSPEQMEAFRQVAPLHTCQPPYNLFERESEATVLPYCRETGVGTLAYGPLCRGLLTGRITEETKFQGDDLRQDDPKFQRPKLDLYLEAVRELDAFAKERYGKRVLHLAVRWVLDHPAVSVALWGARRPDQLDPIAEVASFRLDADARREIASIVDRCVEDRIDAGFMAPPENS